MKMIPYGKQEINDDDIAAVVEALKSDFLTQGPKVKEFEDAFATYVGAKYAVAVCNGTAALHLSTLALNLKQGQKVITTPITFAASANCIRYCGADVVFADIDADTYLLDLNHVKNLLENAPKGTYAGIIVVDFAGMPVNLEEFRKLADAHDCWLLEDACHSPGGFFKDSHETQQFCGNGNFAELSVFSFHPVKHIATGEGGMITTNNKELYDKLLLLRTHGITKDPKNMNENHGGWYYEMQELGYNFRISDVLCALGISQIKKADLGLQRRKEIAKFYDNAFKELIEIITPVADTGHAYHLYVIKTQKRKELFDYLKNKGINCQVHYIPLHTMPYYKNLGSKADDCPRAMNYYQDCLSIPMFASLKVHEQQSVVDSIKMFFGYE